MHQNHNKEKAIQPFKDNTKDPSTKCHFSMPFKNIFQQSISPEM
jgi:hypothetical protein